MKKLMVLLIVMGIASVASAGLTLDVLVNDVAADSVMPGDTVTLIVNGDKAFAGFSALSLTVDNGALVGYSYPDGAFMNTMADTVVGDGFNIAGGISGFAWTLPADGSFLTTVFTVPTDIMASAIAIDFAGSIANDPSAGLSTALTVVPEPMTMALLGFGGLFLRRRRA
jgi:hypothetical protein